MVGTHRRRLQRQRQKEKARQVTAALAKFHLLPPELLAEIHRRLASAFLHRLAFASVCCAASAGHNLSPEPPWLLSFPFPFPPSPSPSTTTAADDDKEPAITGNATVLSLSDGGRSAEVRTSEALRGHFTVVGSSSGGGWLVTADDKAALRMANPVTGAVADLPAITTAAPCIRAFGSGECRWFQLQTDPFVRTRFSGENPPPEIGGPKDRWGRSYTLTAGQMRHKFFRKVVLSDSPPPSPAGYEAMLIMERDVGAPAFATAEDPAWRFAPSRDGVEDAVFHDGKFYSVSYTGQVEAWRRRDVSTGGDQFVADEVGPRMAYEHEELRRRYVAISPEGRVMVVLKHAREVDNPRRQYRSDSKDTRVSFKVHVLVEHDGGDNGGGGGRWEEVEDIGEAAVFVGVNGTMCVSTKEHNKGIRPGCVYFTDDEEVNGGDYGAKTSASAAYYSDEVNRVVDELRGVGVYSLKTRRVERIAGIHKHLLWPTPVWFRPSFL